VGGNHYQSLLLSLPLSWLETIAWQDLGDSLKPETLTGIIAEQAVGSPEFFVEA